jgi:U32 family peptidase
MQGVSSSSVSTSDQHGTGDVGEAVDGRLAEINDLIPPGTLGPRDRKVQVELLAPAGDWECVRAAVENGADAIYFGLDNGFNARARATNFGIDDVPAVMDYVRRRGVKGYVTFNTLVFTDELSTAEETLRALTVAGVDAVLVQDVGLVRLIRALTPDLPVHASTQMSLTSAEGIAVAAELGIERVVLARELSLKEISKIHRATSVPLETFVHGALCVAYSGQCLTSESLGGRSANRGQCAQACRLPYELVCDGQDVDLGPQKYLLSPQDLAAYELTPQLLQAGVVSLKIEGRLKTAGYVANITRHYRRAVDAALQRQPVTFSPVDRQEMELSFSRGFSPGWLQGCDHKQLVPADRSAKRGVCLGTIVKVHASAVDVRLSAPISAGDGVAFDGDRDTGQDQGGRVFGVFRGRLRCTTAVSQGIVRLEFGRDAIDFTRLQDEQLVWKTDDPQLTARLKRSYTAADPIRRVDVSLIVRAETGLPLQVQARSALGQQVIVESPLPLESARRHAATAEGLCGQFDRLGHTVYRLAEFTADIVGNPMVPHSVVAAARQSLIRELDLLAGRIPDRRVAEVPVLPELRRLLPDVSQARQRSQTETPQLQVLCRSLAQLSQALSAGAEILIADFADIREYRPAIQQCRAAGVPLMIATPRIQKPGEMGLYRVLERYAPDAVLVRHLAGLRFFTQRQRPCVADFSLNATNELTVQYLIEQGAQRVTASYDLNREQLLALVDAVPPQWLEVVIHQQMPMFHMEHCVFCAVLSPGTNKTNCGRPCDRHVVHLRDRVGKEHLLTADIGCRNTLFNATPQSSAEVVPTLLERGIRTFRVELLEQSAEQLRTVVQWYRRLLAGEVGGRDVWQALQAANRVGVTRGTLEERRNPLAIL